MASKYVLPGLSVINGVGTSEDPKFMVIIIKLLPVLSVEAVVKPGFCPGAVNVFIIDQLRPVSLVFNMPLFIPIRLLHYQLIPIRPYLSETDLIQSIVLLY